jgi:repressor LexA
MLTERQQDTFNFIRDYIDENGKAPLITEISKGLGIASQGTTHRYVQALVDAKLIERLAGRTRGLRIVADTGKQDVFFSLTLPLMGKVAAGRLIEAVPDESEIDLGEMFSGKDRFVLKVNGDSMIDKAIMSGDYVVMQAQLTAKHGDIVLALVDYHDATLKTLLINDDGTVTLQPANDNYQPMTLPADRVMIQGVVVGQMRTYP